MRELKFNEIYNMDCIQAMKYIPLMYSSEEGDVVYAENDKYAI